MSDDAGAEARVDGFMEAFTAQYVEVYYVMLPDRGDGPSRQAHGFPSFPTHHGADESRRLAEAAGRIPPGCWVKGVLRRTESDTPPAGSREPLRAEDVDRS